MTDGTQTPTETQETKQGKTLKSLLGFKQPNKDETVDQLYVRMFEEITSADDFDAENIKMFSNLAEDVVPEGSTIRVTGSKNKGEKHYSMIGLWVLPALDALTKAKKTFVEDTLNNTMVDRLVDTARRFYKSGQDGEPELPFTPVDFVTRAAGGIQAIYDPAFNALEATIQKVLKQRAKAFTFTKSELFQALSNKAFATYHFESVEKSQLFEKIIAQAITRIEQGLNSPTTEKPTLTHNDVSVNADWFKEIQESRNTATYNVEEIIEADEDFSF